MKNQFISMLLVLALVICVMLAVAPTAEATSAHPHDDATQTHCSCGKAVDSAAITGHTHAANAVTWEVWPGISNVADGGHYYLTRDYHYNNDGNPLNWGSGDKKFTLCLNGYSITQSGRVTVRGTMTICDCASTPGTVTSEYDTTQYFGGVATVYAGGTLNIFGGNLVHAEGKTVKSGGGVFVNGTATFNMYGGSVSGGAASNDGGNIYVAANAAFNMFSGSVSGGSVNTSSGAGGNVYVCADAAFNMYGGLISNTNTAKTAKNGGNIYSKGTVYITGNSVIEGGKADFGGVARIDGGTFTMDSGEIRNGAASNGGNLFVHSANVYVKGTAVIKGGTSDAYGGNVTVRKSTANDAFYLQENAKIMDGVAGNAGVNVFCHDRDASTFRMSGGAVINGAIKDGGAGTISITGGFVELAEDFTTKQKVTINATNDLIIDLNGHKLSGAVNAGDKKLSIVDSTAAVAGAGTGKLEATVTGTLAQGKPLPAAAGNKAGQRYVTIDGVAHRIYIGVENVSLLEDSGDIGMGYTTSFKADAAIKALLSGNEAYGIEVWVEETNKFIGKKDAAAFVAGASGNQVTAHVEAILKAGNGKDVNKTAAETKINARTFIKLDGMDTIYSNTYSFSLQDIIDAAELKGMDKVQAENEVFYNLLVEIKNDYLPAVA